VLGAYYVYLLFDPKGGLLEGDSHLALKVSPALWCLAGGRGCSSKEIIKVLKDAANTTKVEAFKPASEEAVTTVPEAVIGSTFIWVREHFVGLVYLLKFLLSSILAVMVRVILESQLTISALYFLPISIPVYTEDFIIVPFCWHVFC